MTCLKVTVRPVHPKISSLNSEPGAGLDAESSHWLPSAMVLLSFISQIVQCLELCCQATSQTASLRLGIPSHDIKGDADCLARPVSNHGSVSFPLSWLDIKSDKGTSPQDASLPLSLTTTLKPRKEREGSGQGPEAVAAKERQLLVRSLSLLKEAKLPLPSKAMGKASLW